MSPSTIKVGGGIVFTSLAEFTRLSVLKERLDLTGFGDFAPKPRSHETAIKDALSKTFPKLLVEELKGKNGWEVRDVVRGEESNEYPLKFVIRLRYDEDENPKISVGPFEQETADRLVSNFNEQLGLIRCAQVTGCLTSILAKLKGTSLRPKGSLYWIAGHQIDAWTSVTQAVEAAGVGGVNKCYLIRHEMDVDSLRAVRDAIAHEIQTETALIEKEIQSGELGERAIEHRKQQAMALVEKIAEYEEILGQPMADLRALVDTAQQSVMVASMMQMA